MSPADYRLSYRALCFTNPRRDSSGTAAGRDDTIRTCSFLDPDQARYQVAPHPAWHGWRESNPQRAALETVALPVELHPYRTGDEPRTRYLQFGRLTCIPLHLTGLCS